MPRYVMFGEIMLRLACPRQRRIAQSIPGELSATFAGSESNVAAALAQFGDDAQFVTALPEGAVAEACLATLRAQGVNVSRIVLRDEGRLGLFFVETGANQRPTRVTYDRAGSAVSLADAGEYGWDETLADADWFHFSGITPAISEAAFLATRAAVEAARRHSVTVSMDVNYRSALWRWDGRNQPQQLAAEILPQLLRDVDLVFTGAGDAQLTGVTLRSPSGDDDPVATADCYCRLLAEQFSGVRWIAVSLRSQQSASRNDYGCGIYDTERQMLLTAPRQNGQFMPWPVHQIVDRVGTGDAFAAGILHGLARQKPLDTESLQQVLEFATAAGCLAHSVEGDVLYCTKQEVQQLLDGDSTGRVQR